MQVVLRVGLTGSRSAATVRSPIQGGTGLAKQTKDSKVDFEATLGELETLVERMESGELSLEDSLAAFERGVALTRQCQKALSEAELRVKTLTDADSEPVDGAS